MKIDNSNAALKMVRLFSSYATWDLWTSPQIEVEIVAYESAGTIPNYGLKARMGPRDFSSRSYPSGLLGVLSKKAYQAGSFSPPMVSKVHGGYQITRWIYVWDYSNPKKHTESIQQIQEIVGEEGKYQRTILKKSKPPQLVDTYWDFPGYD